MIYKKKKYYPRICKKCGGKFQATGKFNKLCLECKKENYKEGREKVNEYLRKGINIGKPYYMR